MGRGFFWGLVWVFSSGLFAVVASKDDDGVFGVSGGGVSSMGYI